MRATGLGVLGLVLLAWIGGYVLGLGAPDIDSSLEGFRAVVAQEMLERGDWVVPHVGGSIYLSKPPLLPWAIALASLPGGRVTEVTARLPSVLAVLATSLLVLQWARRRGEAHAGAAAALLFLACPLVLEKGPRAEIGPLLTFLVAASLLALFEGGTATPRARARLATVLAWALLALGILAKGPPALVFFLGAGVPWYLARRGRGFHPLDHALGLLLATALVAAWVVPMVSQVGLGTLWETLRQEALVRTTTADAINAEPLAYYLPVLAGGAAPALLFLRWLFLARTRGPRQEGRWREALHFLGWAVVFPLVVFSLFRGKEDRYLLPLYPALALLGGYGASRAVEGFRAGRARDPARVLALAAASALLAAGGALAWALIARYDRPPAEAAVLGAALAALGGLALVGVVRRRLGLFLAALALAFFPLGVARARAWAPFQNAKRSPRAMCQEVNERMPTDASLALLGPTRPQVVFYLRGPVCLRARVDDVIGQAASENVWFVWGPWAQPADRARFERPPGVALTQEARFTWRKDPYVWQRLAR